MRKAKKKHTKRSAGAGNIKRKSIGSKKSKSLAKGGALASLSTLKLEKEFAAIHNTANKKIIEFAKEVKQLKSKLKKTLNKKGKALLQQQIKVAEATHNASKTAKLKLAALKSAIQKFEKDWSKKQAKAEKQAAAKAAKAAAKAKAKASTKKKKARRPSKPTLSSPKPQKPMEGFGSFGTPSPAPFGQTHTLGGGGSIGGGQQHHY